MLEKAKEIFFRAYMIYLVVFYIFIAYMLISEQYEYNERQRMRNAERNMYFHIA